MTKKQRAVVEKFKAGGSKVYPRVVREATLPKSSWWLEGDFKTRQLAEAERIRQSTNSRLSGRDY